MSLSELMIEIPAEYEANVFGQFDVYVKKLERTFHVTLISRDGATKIVGERAAAEKVQRILNQLVELARRGNTITEQNVDYAISLVFEDQEQQLVDIDKDLICHTLQGKPIKPKTLGQKKYVDAIRSGMITFGLGPAGTGKTYLAMAMAITAFKREEVSRIILTRPAIEAGEKFRRISLFITGTVFHFHKHKIFPVSADNVDLTVPSSAEIPFQDTHSLFLQIVRSHLLIYIPRLSGIQPLCFPPFATLSFTMR